MNIPYSPQPNHPADTVLFIGQQSETPDRFRKLTEEHFPGCIIRSVENVNGGFDAVCTYLPDLILIEVDSSEKDVFGICHKVRHNKKTSGIPIILLTSSKVSSEYRAGGFEAGVDDIIASPVCDIEYIAKINRMLQTKKAEDSLRTVTVHLEKIIEKRTMELKKINKQLQRKVEKNIQTEEALRESEERYKTIFDKAPISIWEYDISDACKYMDSIKSSHITDYYSYLSENPDVFLKIISLLKLVDVNHETVKLYGARSKEDIVKKIGKNLIPQALEIYKNALIAFMMGQSHYVCESVNKTIDGRMINILHRITFSDETQKFKRALVTVTDITERKRAEETLRESENRFRSVVEQAGESIFIHDRNGKILDVNQRVCESLGYTRQELLSMSIEDVDVEFISREHKRFWTKLSSSRYVTFTGRHKRKDGSTFPIEVNLGFMELDKQKVYLALTRDITERKRLEEEHSKASKLESLGILSGGIAHDFNNILASILGNISLAKMNLNTKSQGYEMLTDAEKASLRAKDLTKQLLTFSKGGAPFKQPEQISELLKESAGFSVRGSNVRCDCLIPDDLWWAEIDKSQIYQVINNMIINAIQAMPMGGTIEVKADNIVLDNKDAIPLPGGNYVKIIIGDHGIGIPEEYINKIFDPYFTTKQQGSGLGLTTSYSIIKRHDGYIAVESEMGKGTVFEIYLPASKSIRKVDTDESEIDWHVPISGKILVMDDQENVRDVMIRMLNYLGNEVEFACDGAEAIELYKKACDGGKPFDAVIMDLTVPGAMGGLEATKLLLKNDPNARVIMSSGYSNDPVFSNFRRHGFMGIISKPFQFNELKEVLNDVLSRKK